MPRENGLYKHSTLKKKEKQNTLCDQVCYAVLIKVVEKGKTGKQSRNSKYTGSTPYSLPCKVFKDTSRR